MTHQPRTLRRLLQAGSLVYLSLFAGQVFAADVHETTFSITIDRGADVGQSFGSLFEVVSEDGSLVIGAGFQNLYNTRLRADRHSVQFFVRPTDGERAFRVEPLPRPNDLCGTYLSGRDEVVRSTFGGVKAWNASTKTWQAEAQVGGTHESMRVGDGLLQFGDSTVTFNSNRGHPLFASNRGHPLFAVPATGRRCAVRGRIRQPWCTATS